MREIKSDKIFLKVEPSLISLNTLQNLIHK